MDECKPGTREPEQEVLPSSGRQSGSVTLEAAVTFPFVLLALAALFLLVRYFLVFEIVQHAMFETEREMASIYYFWSLSGMEKFQNHTNATAKNANEELMSIAKPFIEIQHAMEGISLAFADAAAGDLTSDRVLRVGGELEALESGLDAAVEQVSRVLDDPLAVLGYMVQAGVGAAAQHGVNFVMQAVSTAFMQKHIPGGNLRAFLSAYDMEHFKAGTIWNAGGQGEIELYVQYVLNIPVFRGYSIPVVQRAVVKGLGLGE